MLLSLNINGRCSLNSEVRGFILTNESRTVRRCFLACSFFVDRKTYVFVLG